MALDASKMHMEPCRFLYCIVVAESTNPCEHPPQMLHDLLLKLVVATVSPPLLKQQVIANKTKTYNLRNHLVWLSKQTTLSHPKHVTITLILQ